MPSTLNYYCFYSHDIYCESFSFKKAPLFKMQKPIYVKANWTKTLPNKKTFGLTSWPLKHMKLVNVSNFTHNTISLKTSQILVAEEADGGGGTSIWRKVVHYHFPLFFRNNDAAQVDVYVFHVFYFPLIFKAWVGQWTVAHPEKRASRDMNATCK